MDATAHSWHPIALSGDIPAGTTRSVILDGKEIVIWRGSDGAARVWEDRCPHRGMRLSYGFVRENNLNCLYHGWQYSGEGPCLKIPAHPDLIVPKTIKPVTYHAAEADGFVWMSFAADGAPVSAIETLPVVSLAIDRPVDTIIALLGDAILADASGAQRPAKGKAPVVTITYPDSTLTIALHAVSADRSMVHAVISGANAEAQRAHFARQLRRLRALAEAAPLALSA